jgi:nitrogen fixation/metabolism regulation signal transduction histidine kinase
MKIAIGLRARFILYLIIIHLLFAGLAIYLLTKHTLWLLAVEAVFVVSLAMGIQLIRNLFGTIELINTGAQFIEDSDFTSRFREIGQPDMDRLIQVYNQMVDTLRNERTRMQEQNYFLEKVLNASPSGIITLDFDGKIAMANRAAERMLMQENDEILGKTLAELSSPFAQAASLVLCGESRVLSLGGRRKVKCQRSQFLDRGFAREFLVLEELTEELRQTEKTAYEKVIRMMSHEVNNSIGSANSLLHSGLLYADQLRDEDRGDFKLALQVAIGRTEHLNSFLRRFADVFRIPPPKAQPCDIQSLIDRVLFLFKPDIATRSIQVNCENNASFTVIADRNQMEQVFVNVIKNSMEAVGIDGWIRIQSGVAAGRHFIEIADSGCGISEEVRANLFTPFYSTKENGQGIGLTLVQEILDAHGFEFSLECQPGGPTRFSIFF